MKPRSYFFNVFANIIGYVYIAGLMFFATSFLIKYFGNDAYALLRITTLSIVGYASLIHTGVNASVRRQFADAYNSGEFNKANKVIGSAILLYSIFFLIVVVLMYSITYWFPSFIHAPDTLVYPFKILLIACGVYLGILFMQSIFTAIFMVTSHYEIMQSLFIFSRTAYFVFIFVLINIAIEPLIAASIAQIVVPIVIFLLSFLIVRRIFKQIKPVLFPIDKDIFKHFLLFGANSTLIVIGPLLVFQAQPIIIGQKLTLTDVTVYSTAMLIFSQIDQIVEVLIMPIYPIANKLKTENRIDLLGQLYIDSVKRGFSVITLIIVPLYFFAPDFFATWLLSEFRQASGILYIMMLANMVMPFTTTTNIILTAGGM